MMDVGQDLNPWPYVCLLAALLVMAPFFLKDLIPSGRPRNVKDKQSSSRDRRNSSGSRNSGRGNLCEVCGQRPKFVETATGYTHPYCGRTCARASQQKCKYPSCNDPGKSAFSGYCGHGHAGDAVRQGSALPCAECGKQPLAIGDLCLACNSSIGKSTEPRLKELSLQDPKADSVTTHFHRQWKGSEPAKVAKIYEIRLPRHIIKAREAYSSKLSALGTPRQIQTFHSTQCICDLGTNSLKFCTWDSCGICAIIKSAFNTFEFGAKSNSGRCGSGVYSYLESSLADRHAVSTTTSPYRVMLACEVDLLPPRVQPPKFAGIAHSHEDGPLVFVSRADAIVPKYLILYSKPSTTPPRSHSRTSLYS